MVCVWARCPGVRAHAWRRALVLSALFCGFLLRVRACLDFGPAGPPPLVVELGVVKESLRKGGGSVVACGSSLGGGG